MKTITVRRPLKAEMCRALGVDVDWPVLPLVAERDGEIIASGGLAWGEGRCWAWYAIVNQTIEAISLVRLTQRTLRLAAALGETAVYVTRDASYPTAERLIGLCGFKPTGETHRGNEVYVWVP